MTNVVINNVVHSDHAPAQRCGCGIVATAIVSFVLGVVLASVVILQNLLIIGAGVATLLFIFGGALLIAEWEKWEQR